MSRRDRWAFLCELPFKGGLSEADWERAAPQTALDALGAESFALFLSWGMYHGASRALWWGYGSCGGDRGLLADLCCVVAAGRTTTSEELEDMLESGNPAIFSSGVSTAAGAAPSALGMGMCCHSGLILGLMNMAHIGAGPRGSGLA